MQSLWTKTHVYVGRAPDDRRPFLAGDTATDTDDKIGSIYLEFAPHAQLREHLLLRFLAYRAGIQ